MTKQFARSKPRFYTPRELGERWGRNRITIVRAIKSGKLRAVRLANHGTYMIPANEVARVERGEQ